MAASISGPMDRSTLVFFTTSALAAAFKIASAAIITSLLASILVSTNAFGLGVAASVFEVFAVLSMLTSLALFLKRSSTRAIYLAWIPGAISCLLGAILSLIALACTIKVANDREPHSTNIDLARNSAGAGIAIAVVGLIPQTAFYVLVWPRAEQERSSPLEVTQHRPSPSRSSNRHSISLRLGTIGPSSPPKFYTQAQPASPSRSMFYSSQRSSMKESASQILRPMASKTRLMVGSPFSSTRDVRSIVSASDSRPDGIWSSNDDFGDWDTSAIEARYDSPLGSKARVARLETIPGSRPVSPGGALDGPFPGNDDLPEDIPLPESALPSPMPPASDTASLRSPRPIVRVNTDTTNNEAHIHPLFRIESPAPPPMASPNTVITASPFAGQVVNAERAMSPMSSWRNGSRPGTPSAVASPSRSRTGSMKSFRTVPASAATSPIEAPQRSFSNLSRTRAVMPND
ncbi:Hypothetical predicted protein [Lecanosticta acicola]|uniref:Uncharacterized protein n=1 Tax=Lecanosticta acicola TaxID=111012 RepID=A0AAI9ECJ6_9PEZI|nr:Hypothetical predicted protein [Lecanosticta acicola]